VSRVQQNSTICIVDDEQGMSLYGLGHVITGLKFVLVELQVIIPVDVITGHPGKEGGIFTACCIILGKGTGNCLNQNSGHQTSE
jgi:hypothetical protein